MKGKERVRFLKSKPRRSLCKLQLKFVQTTAEVSRKYYVLTNLSTRTYLSICVYLRKCLPRTHFSICAYLLKRVRRIHFIVVVIEEPQRSDTPA